SQKKNILYDITMSSYNSVHDKVSTLTAQGYKDTDVNAIFVDIDSKTSLQRSKTRYARGIIDYTENNKGHGGRLVLESIITDQATENSQYKSKNAETLVKLHQDGVFKKHPRVFNNNADGQEPFEYNYLKFANIETLDNHDTI